MSIPSWRLVLGLLAVTFGMSCSGDELPPCDEVSWLDRQGGAKLTGDLSFSASQIVSGDPLTVRVPVNEHTTEVRLSTRLADGAAVRSLRAGIHGDELVELQSTNAPVAALSTETDGDEVVELALTSSDLAVGVYFLDFIHLSGNVFPDDTTYRVWDTTLDEATTYVISVDFAAESGADCQSNIPVATFEVVNPPVSGSQ